MASNDTEIEVKVPLTEDELRKVTENVKILSKFVKNSRHVDSYYTPSSRDFLEPQFPFEWLSVRERDGRTILSYKHYYPENVEAPTHCDEFEMEVGKPEQFGKIFSALGVRKIVTVEKSRDVYVYNGEFEIGIDDVKDLGKFIEVEATKDFGGVDATRKKVMEFARKIGVDTSKADKRGYPFMLMRKKGLIRE